MIQMRLLSADIGGTNARLQLWHSALPNPAHEDFTLVHGKVFPSKDFKSLGRVVEAFLRDCGIPVPYGGESIDAACIAVCGPVENEDRMCGPVLPEQPPTQWNAQKSDLLTGSLKGVILRAVLINDFIGVGLGLTVLDRSKEMETLHDAPRNPEGPIACIGAGTGLGAVYLTYNPAHKHHVAWASEGGMTEFCARSEEEWQLRQYLFQRDGHVTVEGVVSGPGIANAYRFLLHQRGEAAPEQSEEKLERWVVAQALSGADETCGHAVDVMVRAWAAKCRDVALTHLPSGGLYVAGGMAPRLLPRLRTVMAQAYGADPVMGALIRTFPLYAVLNDDVGLLGARVRAFYLAQESA